MTLTYTIFFVALCLSAIGAFYSIVGLAAIFSAAAVPIMVMGSVLEISKIVVTLWLHQYWHRAKLAMKIYLVPAVAVLMLITSMGIFGFLSKAHMDQAVPAEDIAAELAVYDEKIKTQRDNIAASRRALDQMDAQVDQLLGRTTDDRGANRAVQTRKQQAQERAQLQNDIVNAQKEIVQLQEQRAPKAAQVREVEAEVGPIKYIAELMYGDNASANLAERAVRWVIMVLVAVFDPLAIMMLLAATESLKWDRERSGLQIPTLSDLWKSNVPTEDETMASASSDVVATLSPQANTMVHTAKTDTAQTNNVDDSDDVDDVDDSDDVDDVDDSDDAMVKLAKFYWKQDHPDLTLKEQRRRLTAGEIDQLPWLSYLNDPRVVTGMSFGTSFPAQAQRGDVFVMTNHLPTKLYKFNGDKWIEIDKNGSDHYAFSQGYIDYLIKKISAGEYDPELLTDTERLEIETKLRQEV